MEHRATGWGTLVVAIVKNRVLESSRPGKTPPTPPRRRKHAQPRETNRCDIPSGSDCGMCGAPLVVAGGTCFASSDCASNLQRFSGACGRDQGRTKRAQTGVEPVVARQKRRGIAIGRSVDRINPRRLHPVRPSHVRAGRTGDSPSHESRGGARSLGVSFQPSNQAAELIVSKSHRAIDVRLRAF